MKTVKKIIYRSIFRYGFNIFKKKGKTPEKSYQALVNLYCLTDGQFNETLHEKVKLPAEKVAAEFDGFLGHFTRNDFEKVNQTLIDDGYVRFEKLVSKETLDKLQKFAMETPTKVHGINERVLFNPVKLVSEIYRFDVLDLVNNSEIQEFIMDPVLMNIARKYLDCEPIFDFAAMWWSAGFKKEASSDAAQLYHFDMDRIKWLKVFIYVNDVDDYNGPHCYVSGTHKVGAKPANILSRGYVRVSDEELKTYYPESSFKVLPGKAGSVFAGDTMCWHKGKPLEKGKNRLMLEFEYSSFSFGANLPTMVVKNASDKFKAFCKKHPVYTSQIEIK